ncbi:aminoglycoside 6'-N-acetyltransferase [Neofamilia massiliensis]|uniref:aminoglycoside 6'-N-acetyltransferase n=1 Tax=Neofamilia massiliensis TaxID=1673724 RepID=UPI0006BB9493|nr:aminoglycoside 6'-N-acetyltransferase [Neofamilia massiliensis]
MIRKADKDDAKVLADLALNIFDGASRDELIKEFEDFAGDENIVSFIKFIGDEVVGFAQCGLRFDYVEGCENSPVAYLEGIYVKEAFRKKNIGRDLVMACEKWARDKGVYEFASDCQFDNISSYNFHLALGFKEVGRIIAFKKDLK